MREDATLLLISMFDSININLSAEKQLCVMRPAISQRHKHDISPEDSDSSLSQPGLYLHNIMKLKEKK